MAPMRTAIHQFVPMLHRNDAVGRHTLRIRDVLHERGIQSNVYVEMTDPDTAADTKLFPAYDADAQQGDLLLYQLATASNLAPWLAGRRETLAVSYHNVTPPEFYAAWNNPMARHQLRAIHELMRLAPRTALAVAVSQFNEAELKEHGYARTAVVPPAAMAPTPPATPGQPPATPGSRPPPPPPPPLLRRRQAAAAGCRSAASPPTRASSWPSWPSS